MHSFILEPSEVKSALSDPSVRVVDCRFDLGNRSTGAHVYKEAHIPGAVYAHLEEVLSSPVLEHGGRHPLPSVDNFVSYLEAQGITNDTKVIAYDDQGGAMASRFFWLMKYVGNQETYILNGGFQAWKEAGYDVTKDVTSYPKASYTPMVQHDMKVDMEQLKNKLLTEDVLVIDSREEKRYKGLEEPIDAKAGHIPGAQNKFWKGILKSEQRWASAEELRAHFSDIDRTKEIIVYCGSGVTACPNIVALLEAGFTNVKLYPGSWSDWITYEGNLIDTDLS
ncbi:sulfurtransferase [Priestia koreensis]|uniref:3-mercaptopyruvate sulfurtransferase n=1 Tax=Priestia koreensis TaxID=284581 RepID=A0A0M0LIK3_9BACI|nr:sulfurtransferase [Priestia koreensis]KOO50742.1 3-mercaptopyruvate sulfurtransferase [Priestia koreensis]